MLHSYFLQILFILLLIFSFTTGRKLSYDQYHEQENSQSDLFPPDNDQYVQERKFHQRAIFPTSSATHSRQQFIDLLRQAYSQGWKPNIKHYMPATRFGRHR